MPYRDPFSPYSPFSRPPRLPWTHAAQDPAWRDALSTGETLGATGLGWALSLLAGGAGGTAFFGPVGAALPHIIHDLTGQDRAYDAAKEYMRNVLQYRVDLPQRLKGAEQLSGLASLHTPEDIKTSAEWAALGLMGNPEQEADHIAHRHVWTSGHPELVAYFMAHAPELKDAIMWDMFRTETMLMAPVPWDMAPTVPRGWTDQDDREVTAWLQNQGLMSRFFLRRVGDRIDASWKMYPLGILFGLGFDTASEVALLAISAGAAAQGLPFQAVVSLPIIFAAGMSLMDTTDGAFMSKAYAWAFSNPVRKVFYNLTVTSLSVFVALFVGVVELSQLLINQLKLSGGIFDAISGFSFASLGFVIVAAFVVTWVAALVIFKVRRVEERWGEIVAGE